jgi:mannose-6-phosphate isomerase-like protein (cupin superfamily)
MQTFHFSKILDELHKNQQPWLEFLRTSSLSMGVYHLKTGQPDLQHPHTEDEVYYIVNGRGSFRAGSKEQPVSPGMLIFVERAVKHRFFDITEDLTVLVFFAPAEGSLKK